MVKRSLAIPSVVIYNGAVRNVFDPADPLSGLSTKQVEYDMAVNCISAILAAHHAVLGFKQLPSSPYKTFIYTGNKLNFMTLEQVPLFGIGKSAASYLIHTASKAYQREGFKFYYTNERTRDGSQAGGDFDGLARAKLHVQLAEDSSQGPWNHSFVSGSGYINFGNTVEE
ncbi:aldo-keto reductase [Fusarium beomiforme]|uniref:Aldo-keto reductase n=1 Tax=Fusarium beomiforme TaxID=44412 RepID=A0A9P5A3X5_9HYPO|nr:aldo-keto reductase [Fusarium beomiforme]